MANIESLAKNKKGIGQFPISKMAYFRLGHNIYFMSYIKYNYVNNL